MKPHDSTARAKEARMDAIRDFLHSESNQKMVSFVLSALLHSNYSAPVYLFAPEDKFESCADAIAQTAPRGRRRGLTFAMRESGVLRSDARVTGFWSSAAGADLPDACYEAPNAAFHARTGRHSEHIAAAPYAEYAVGQLAQGRSLDAFLRLCDECGVRSADDLQDLFALEYAPARLDFARLGRLVDKPETLARVRQSPPARKRCEEWLRTQLDEAVVHLTEILRRAQQIAAPKADWMEALERLTAVLRPVAIKSAIGPRQAK